MGAVTHPRQAPRRGTAGATWWSKAWLRAVEESAFAQRDLLKGRATARAGAVGAITVAEGSLLAAVAEGDDVYTVTASLPVLDADGAATVVELVASEAGRIGALLSGDLPHPLVEAMEEAGVEMLPYGGEVGSSCSCDAWLDPCPHALAVLTQAGWLIQADPLVLVHLRGLPRDELLARLHALDGDDPAADPADLLGGAVAEADDLAVAEDAAVRATRILDAIEADPEADLSRWW